MADKQTATILDEELDDRPILPVGGVYGAPSPDGTSVIVHIYSEYATLPAREEYDIKEDGSIDVTSGHGISRGQITRKIVATLIMSEQVARGAGQWLVAQANMLASRGKKGS